MVLGQQHRHRQAHTASAYHCDFHRAFSVMRRDDMYHFQSQNIILTYGTEDKLVSY
jgi:hypothetical protein